MLRKADRLVRALGVLAALTAALVAHAGCQQTGSQPAERELQQTASGLKYRIRRVGNGRYPDQERFIRMHYRGWLDDGTVFESTYERGEPAAMRLKSAIPGWQEGVPLVREGGAIELEIPPQLAYGEQGTSLIPPNATLHFLVEVVEVVDR